MQQSEWARQTSNIALSKMKYFGLLKGLMKTSEVIFGFLLKISYFVIGEKKNRKLNLSEKKTVWGAGKNLGFDGLCKKYF